MNLKKMRKKLIGAILVAVMVAQTVEVPDVMAATVESRNSDLAIEVATELFDAVNAKDWETYTALRCQEDRDYFREYFMDDSMTDGIKQVESVSIEGMYVLDNEAAKAEWLTSEYTVLEESDEVYSLLCELDCQVTNENTFFYNGINFFLLVLAAEDDGLKIVQFDRPSTALVKDTLSTADLSEAEECGLQVLEASDYGLAINAENEMITDGFVAAEVGGAGIATLTADPPLLKNYMMYSYPSTIKVRLDKTGDDKIVTVDMLLYTENALASEWFSWWDAQSLKAGAYCVKMVGIYRTLKPESSDGGYDITQTAQMYNPELKTGDIASSFVTAVTSIKNSGMASYTGLIFFPMYSAGTEGSLGTKGSGSLKQWGSQELATTYGYTYKEILNYYYSGSEYSPSGDVMIFSYNIGF